MNATNARAPAGPSPAIPVPPLGLEAWGDTHPGRVRPQNEDVVWPQGGGTPLPDGNYLLLVADGVGGAQAGGVASRIVADEIVRYCQANPLTNPGQALAQAMQSANAAVHNHVAGSPSVSEAASTATVAIVKGGQAYVANVGDSRAYLIRDGMARQLTRDHTLTQQKLDAGHITPAQAGLDEERNVITRSLGIGPCVQVDVFPPLPLQPGDALLLCSDGLTDMLSEADLARLATRGRPHAAVRRLIAEANRRGGYDNISVVIGKASNRPSAAAWDWPLALFLVGGVLLVIAVLLMVGWLVLGQSQAIATPTAVATPTALAGMVFGTVPSASAAPTVLASPTARAEVTSLASVAATSTPLPTYTPAPIPTLATPPAPIPTAAAPVAAPGQPTRAPLPPASDPLAAPVLLDPPEGASAIQDLGTTFKWRWDGQMAEGWGFEVRIWQEGDPDHFGAFHAGELMKYLDHQPDSIYAVSFLVEGAYSVRLHGGGDYYWTVAVVQVEPYQRISLEAPPRKLRFVIPGGPEPPEEPEKPPQVAPQ